MPNFPNPKLRDEKNMVVYFDKEDITDELIRYWGQDVPPYYMVSEYQPGGEQDAAIEKNNAEYNEKQSQKTRIVELETEVNSLKGRLQDLENK